MRRLLAQPRRRLARQSGEGGEQAGELNGLRDEGRVAGVKLDHLEAVLLRGLHLPAEVERRIPRRRYHHIVRPEWPRQRRNAGLVEQLRERPVRLLAGAVWIHASRRGRGVGPVRAVGLVADEASEPVDKGVVEHILDREEGGEVDVAGGVDVDDRLSGERMPDDDRVAAVPEERCAVELRLRDVLAGQVGRDRGVPERLELAHDVGEAPPAVPGSVHEDESRHLGEYPNSEP